MDLKAKNFEGRSAFDVATNEEMRDPSDERISVTILRIASGITEEQRNAYMIIATLVMTTTYESVMSPPGGVYQASAGDKNATTISTSGTQRKGAGISVLSEVSFFMLSNMFSFLISSATIFITRSTVFANLFLHPYLSLLYASDISFRSYAIGCSFFRIPI
ncbi:unnamed protein product [Sphenostylis stenocarpa]|uniref:PGG domain-containing protein n=1 Tax=Sphenostylis stenocarpa TaxID=92480 RepID=A0AA86W5Y3_9FABA|nr:unnamed protein product [Sphenostylis stenocarpa]